MLNVKYWRIFCEVISLLAQVCIVSVARAYKEESTKKIEIFYEGQFFQWIEYNPISILYTFQIDIF